MKCVKATWWLRMPACPPQQQYIWYILTSRRRDFFRERELSNHDHARSPLSVSFATSERRRKHETLDTRIGQHERNANRSVGRCPPASSCQWSQARSAAPTRFSGSKLASRFPSVQFGRMESSNALEHVSCGFPAHSRDRPSSPKPVSTRSQKPCRFFNVVRSR